MWEKFKTASMIVIITVLIWFTADQNISEEQSLSLPIRLTSSSPDRYAAFADAPQVVFQITAVGRRRQLKELSDLIASTSTFDAVMDETKKASPQPQIMTGREILGAVREINNLPVRLRNVDPSTVSVRIDQYETVAGIRVAPNYGDLKVSAAVTPGKVSVRLPSFLAEKLRADPVATADADQRIRSARRPDGGFQIKVPLTFEALKDMEPDMRIEILPSAEVQISGQIESQTATTRKGPIQITWSIPQKVQEDFKVVIDPSANLRPDIDLSGPKDAIEQLDPREIRAFVDVYAADTEKPQTPIRRSVQFVLPPGVTLAPGSQAYDVVFQLEPRGTTERGAGSP
ncbi:MAG TPA: hypothetical protein VMV81_11645 [Phycisphaerae bacterium]|nr:hypothetical protein [Phycisphaerae bacterium]